MISVAEVNLMPLFVVLNHSPSFPTQGLKQPPGMEFPNASGTSSVSLLAIRSVMTTMVNGREGGKSIPQTLSLIKITLKS